MLHTVLPVLRQDERLAVAIGDGRLPLLETDQDLYAGLIRAVVYQQLSGKAAKTIHERFLNLFPHRYPDAGRVLAMSESELRSVGLSRQKAAYILNLARFFQEADTEDLLRWEDEALVHHLTQIKGIGTWTVQMILLFNLGRPDVFPPGDLGIQKAMQQLYGLEGKGKALRKSMLSIAENWRPYRSYATRFLWRYLS